MSLRSVNLTPSKILRHSNSLQKMSDYYTEEWKIFRPAAFSSRRFLIGDLDARCPENQSCPLVQNLLQQTISIICIILYWSSQCCRPERRLLLWML